MPEPEPLQLADLPVSVAILLATPGSGRAADARQVRGFCEYLAQGPVRWEGWRFGQRNTPSALFFALLLPGRTAIVMIPSPGEHGIEPGEQLQITQTGLARLGERDLHYAQALIEPEAAAKRALLEQIGLQPLAPLEYLERAVAYPWADPPAPDEAEWVSYDEQTHAEFAEVIAATYQESRDCPELTGLRPIEDVLAAHRAAGFFDPALWELARVGGQAAGCLLLSRLAQAPMLEVVYMGVVPAMRRRGVGQLLLRRALAQCRAGGARRLTVVVDGRNEPAKRLYARFALMPVARRDAYLYRWRRT
jgi:ribosomal protein S18 acetylase RimI-like enzyme